METALLFTKCLGLNDSKVFGTIVADPKTGITELLDCQNVTVTPDGRIEKIPAFVTEFTHPAPITDISAGSRFIYQDGIDVKEWNGTAVATIGAVLSGNVAHTPIDVRISSPPSVFKSGTSGGIVSVATLGDTSAIPETSKTYAAQPVFKQAFTYNGFLYGINAEDPRFLQHSEYAYFDVWNIADNFIGHQFPILQAGAIPGCMICTHKEGVSVYSGTNRNDFVKRFYPLKVVDNTLAGGYIGSTYVSPIQSRSYVYCHVFLCEDGFYAIAPSGELIPLSEARTTSLVGLNSSYSCAVISNGKYLAFGNTYCLEFDFEANAPLKRDLFGVQATTTWGGKTYYAIGNQVVSAGKDISTAETFSASIKLPYSDLGLAGRKSIAGLYFTGTLNGDVTIIATDQEDNSWEIELSEEWENVSNQRIITPKGIMGNHISFEIICTAGAFRLEELRAVLTASKRNR